MTSHDGHVTTFFTLHSDDVATVPPIGSFHFDDVTTFLTFLSQNFRYFFNFADNERAPIPVNRPS